MSASRPATTHAPRAVLAALLVAAVLFELVAPVAIDAVTAAGQATHSMTRLSAQGWFLVVDRATILDDGQERSAIDDAFRLSQRGVPVQVWTENTGFDQEQADFRADELRVANGIESAPNRDDGVLIYVSVDPRDDSAMSISFSVGTHALPNGGLTFGNVETIREMIAIPQIEDGHPARAIVYSIREMIYQQMFTPPPMEAISSARQKIGTILSIAAPLVTLALAGWILAWRRHASWWIPLVMGTAAAMLLAVLAIVSRSEIGIASALLLGLLIIWQAIRRDRWTPDGTSRRLRVTPRPPTEGRGVRTAIR